MEQKQTEIESLDLAVMERLGQVVKTKTGQAVVDPETGEPVTAVGAMAMSVVSAAKGGEEGAEE